MITDAHSEIEKKYLMSRIGKAEYRTVNGAFHNGRFVPEHQIDYIIRNLGALGLGVTDATRHCVIRHGSVSLDIDGTPFESSDREELRDVLIAINAFQYFVEDVLAAFYREAGADEEEIDEETGEVSMGIYGYDAFWSLSFGDMHIDSLQESFSDIVNTKLLFREEAGDDRFRIFGKEFDFASDNFWKELFGEFQKVARREVEDAWKASKEEAER